MLTLKQIENKFNDVLEKKLVKITSLNDENIIVNFDLESMFEPLVAKRLKGYLRYHKFKCLAIGVYLGKVKK